MIPEELRRRVDAAREIDPGEPAWREPSRWPSRWNDWPDSPLPFERARNQPEADGPVCERPSRAILWIALAWAAVWIGAIAVSFKVAG